METTSKYTEIKLCKIFSFLMQLKFKSEKNEKNEKNEDVLVMIKLDHMIQTQKKRL